MPRPERLVFNDCIRWVMHSRSSITAHGQTQVEAGTSVDRG